MKRWLGVVVLAAFAIVAGRGSAGVETLSLKPCDSDSTVLCGTLPVPLDPSGRRSGVVRLHVEELPAAGAGAHKVMFIVAGGPGQASAETFDLQGNGNGWQTLFPGYTLIAYDDRGTGRSGRIGCPGLLAVEDSGPEKTAAVIGACGRKLGARSSLYSTLDNANDMDAIRAGLGVDQIAIFGASYGTKQALGYALAYPTHVSRLVLDSVVAPNWPYPFLSSTLRALPHGLADLCQGVCKGITRNPGADLAKLANQLAAKPVVTRVHPPGGKPVAVHLDGYALVELALETDLNPGLAAELPAAVSAGLAGNMQPLVRLLGLEVQIIEATGSPEVDLAVSVATQCADGSFFWSADTAVGSRAHLLGKAIAALPSGSMGLFGNWAAMDGPAKECEKWPATTVDSRLPPDAHLPNVPVLILSGGRDIRTPTSIARRVAAAFPRSHLVIVPGGGHAVSTTSACADRFIRNWLRGLPHKACGRLPLGMAPIRGFPQTDAPAGQALTSAQTLSVAAATLREVEATALVAQGARVRVGGLVSGSFRWISERSLQLTQYSDVDGVVVKGILLRSRREKGGWIGVVSVGGPLAASGELNLFRDKLTGVLAGKSESKPAEFAD